MVNIYLDVDGVLLASDRGASARVDEFLQAAIKKYPNNTYWLTTYCWNGVNRAVEALSPYVVLDTLKLLGQVKPTTWRDHKTEGIDFSQPFLWFDDNLSLSSRTVLEKHNVLSDWIEVNLYKNPNQLKDLKVKYFN